MNALGDKIRTVGSLAGLIGVIVAGVWYIFGLDGRIRRLEEQVHTLTVSPTINSMTTPGTPTANPIADACAQLATKSVDAIARGRVASEVPYLQDTMQKLGCNAVGTGR